MTKKFSLYAMIIFYLLNGINHFYNPEMYYQIIPLYFGASVHVINIASGVAEILLAMMLMLPESRRAACYGVILLLLAFVPAHIEMIRKGFCIAGSCLPLWASWVRLFVIQPLLIYWAWKVGKGSKVKTVGRTIVKV